MRLASIGGGVPPTYIEDVFSVDAYTGNSTTTAIINGINLGGLFTTGAVSQFRTGYGCNKVVWGNGKYVTSESNKIYSSVDGLTWTRESTISGAPVGSGWLMYDGTSTYIFIDNYGYAWTSTNLTSWTQKNKPYASYSSTAAAVAYAGGNLVWIGTNPSSGTQGDTFTSSDYGTTWVSRTSTFSSNTVNPSDLKVVNGILFGLGGSVQGKSTNGGVTWTQLSMPNVYGCLSIAYGGGRYVIGQSVGYTAYSTDASTWTQGSIDAAVSATPAIEYVNGKFIAVCGSAYNSVVSAFTSADGLTWTKSTGFPCSGYSGQSNPAWSANNGVTAVFIHGNFETTAVTTGSLPAGTSNGGTVWIKNRNGTINHALFDTVRGPSLSDSPSYNPILASNLTAEQGLSSSTAGSNLDSVHAFAANGFAVAANRNASSGIYCANVSGYNYVAQTFKKQPKFFDVVTATPNGAGLITFNHALGVTPGCVMIKCVGASEDWIVYHQAIGTGGFIKLNSTIGSSSSAGLWSVNSSSVTYDGSKYSFQAGQTYVAQIFAHNAGGFGATGNDNVISCGSFTGSALVNMGFEPQWLLIKNITNAGNWYVMDNLRGFNANGYTYLAPNTAGGEVAGATSVQVNSTGFASVVGGTDTYIYIAIRRPMKVPTDATKVFAPVARTGTAVATTVKAGFPVDLAIIQDRPNAYLACWFDRLRGAPKVWFSQSQNAESNSYPQSLTGFDSNTGVTLGYDSYVNTSDTYANWFFQRAPGFFDNLTFAGTGATQTLTHNLGVRPELMIFKCRDGAGPWVVVAAITSSNYRELALDQNWVGATDAYASTANLAAQPTSTQISLGSNNQSNSNGNKFGVYLFASCPGVSMVGSYSGTGAAQTINCGFTAGARFVMIKRIDGTSGDWYIWDTARGIGSGNDPYLLLNSIAAEVTTTNYLAPQAVGFGLTATAPADLNASGGTYIFLAIA